MGSCVAVCGVGLGDDPVELVGGVGLGLGDGLWLGDGDGDGWHPQGLGEGDGLGDGDGDGCWQPHGFGEGLGLGDGDGLGDGLGLGDGSVQTQGSVDGLGEGDGLGDGEGDGLGDGDGLGGGEGEGDGDGEGEGLGDGLDDGDGDGHAPATISVVLSVLFPRFSAGSFVALTEKVLASVPQFPTFMSPTTLTWTPPPGSIVPTLQVSTCPIVPTSGTMVQAGWPVNQSTPSGRLSVMTTPVAGASPMLTTRRKNPARSPTPTVKPSPVASPMSASLLAIRSGPAATVKTRSCCAAVAGAALGDRLGSGLTAGLGETPGCGLGSGLTAGPASTVGSGALAAPSPESTGASQTSTGVARLSASGQSAGTTCPCWIEPLRRGPAASTPLAMSDNARASSTITPNGRQSRPNRCPMADMPLPGPLPAH